MDIKTSIAPVSERLEYAIDEKNKGETSSEEIETTGGLHTVENGLDANQVSLDFAEAEQTRIPRRLTTALFLCWACCISLPLMIEKTISRPFRRFINASQRNLGELSLI